MNEAAALGKAIRDGTVASGAILIEATVHSDGSASGPTVVVEQPDAIRLIVEIKPRVIYLFEQPFDLMEEIETPQEELESIGADSPSDGLKSVRRRFAGYEGQVSAAIAAFMIDGILHTVVSTAGWYDEFGSAIEAIVAAAREDAAANRFSERSAQAQKVGRKAALLARHPSFNYGRVSFDKRMMLAEALFEDCDQGELSEITRRAEHLFWLEQSGFQRGMFWRARTMQLRELLGGCGRRLHHHVCGAERMISRHASNHAIRCGLQQLQIRHHVSEGI